MVRCFESEDVTHVENKINPLNDIQVIETELLLSDLSKAENIIESLQKKNSCCDISGNMVYPVS